MVSFRYEGGSEEGTPQGDGECPYLAAEGRDAVAFIINARVVDLLRKFHLCMTADRQTGGDRCNIVRRSGKEKEMGTSKSMMSVEEAK